MANMGCARPGRVCYDPFSGTGSLLIAAAHYGSVCLGSDIDHKMSSMREGQKNITTNFKHYDLPLPQLLLDIVRCDNSRNSSLWAATRKRPLFDAIICDPPYGIRAGAKKLGVKEGTVVRVPPPEFTKVHIPQTVAIGMDEVLEDLFDLADRTLIIGACGLPHFHPHASFLTSCLIFTLMPHFHPHIRF